MENKFQKKYLRIEEIMPDIAACADMKLILVGGTALAIFYLRHRASVDVDFMPIDLKNEEIHTRRLKGEFSKRGYRASRAAYTNQFVINFENTTIKVEIFVPEGHKPLSPEQHDVGGRMILVARLEDLAIMKNETYKSRKQGRDLYDLYCIPERYGGGTDIVKKLVNECGKPENLEDVGLMAFDQNRFKEFVKVIADAV